MPKQNPTEDACLTAVKIFGARIERLRDILVSHPINEIGAKTDPVTRCHILLAINGLENAQYQLLMAETHLKGG